MSVVLVRERGHTGRVAVVTKARPTDPSLSRWLGETYRMDHGAIVIGAGHNGLICAAYLARAGVDTLLLEARDSVGGCASTVDALGARVNICNCDHTVFRTTPVIDELALADHGLTYLDVDPAQLQLAWSGGPAWPIFHDVGRTLDALAFTYPDEIEGYRRYADTLRPVVELILELATSAPTTTNVLATLAGRRARGVATLLRLSRMSVGDVLRSFFTADALQGPAYVTGPGVWGLSPDTPGTGLGALTYAMKHVATVGRPVGGSGAVPTAVLGAFEAAGGRVRCGARVAEIVCEGEAVRGVRLTDGTLIEAATVISACDPRQTFVSWLAQPPAVAHDLVERWRRAPTHEGYESKIDAVVAERPRYRQVDDQLMARLGVDPLTATAIVAPSLDASRDAHARMAQGAVAEQPMLFCNIPSVLDPTMRVPGPDGGDVFSLEVLFTPFSLQGGWPGSGEPQRWLEAYSTLVQPGWLDSVRRHRAMTPDRYESEFNLPNGYATSFGGGPLAALLGRQPELTRYRTPVRGLYLTGAATYPGAGVWGASGRNAAHVVLADA